MLRYIASAIVFLSYQGLALAQDAPVQTPGTSPNAPAGAPGWMNMVLLAGMILFMWLFIIRPQSKRQKEHRTFLDSLQTGMEVVTSGGIIGRVTNVSDTIVTIDVGNGSVRVLKSAVSGKLGAPATA